MKRDYFEYWLIKCNNKKGSVAYQYRNAVDSISKHYSQQTGKEIDLYDIDDIIFIKGLVRDYGTNGKYQEFGNKGNGTKRNAIARYAEFIQEINNESIPSFDEWQKSNPKKGKKQTQVRQEITPEMTAKSYEIGKNVYKKQYDMKKGAEYVNKETGMNITSAAHQIHNLICMLDGKCCKRFMAKDDRAYFLKKIKEDYPEEMYQNALHSVKLQDEYKKECYKKMKTENKIQDTQTLDVTKKAILIKKTRTEEEEFNIDDNNIKVKKGFRILIKVLEPYIIKELKNEYKNDWWQEGVINFLSREQQRGIIKDKLDVATSLSLIDIHWDRIFKKKHQYPRKVRSWVNELKDDRNINAHDGTDDISYNDASRTLDTMSRLCDALGERESGEKIKSIIDTLHKFP
jgi:hypothetical protein